MEPGHYQLHHAIKARNTFLIQELLKNGANVCQKDEFGSTPFHLTAQENLWSIAKLILQYDRKFDIDIQDYYDQTALHLAAQSQSSDYINLLLHYGMNVGVNIQDKNGQTPLHLVAKSNLRSCIHAILLRAAKVDINIRDRDGRTPLHLAAQSNSLECVESILQTGAQLGLDVNIPDDYGRTPLHLASRSGSWACVCLILEEANQVDTNFLDEDGCTYIDLATTFSVWEGWQSHISTLFRHGVLPSDIKRWGHNMEDSSIAMQVPGIFDIWENAEKGFDYGSVHAFLQELLKAETDKTILGFVVLEWELPAVLKLSDPVGIDTGQAQRMVPLQDVVLVRHESTTAYEKASCEFIQATTCEKYFKEHFNPELYSFVLDLLEQTISANLNSSSPGFTTDVIQAVDGEEEPPVFVTCLYSSISINFRKGSLAKAVDLVRALEWLCRAMRLPSNQASLTLSTSNYRMERREFAERNKASPSSGPTSLEYVLGPRINLTASSLPNSEHDCWKLLFSSCIVADSESPRHRKFGKGLEISFELMVSLAAVEFCLTIEGGVVFIGYQTMLFPTAIQGDCAQFHLKTSKNGQINPYMLKLGDRVLTEDPSLFQNKKCFLGWCEEAQINLGTKQLPATVKWSGGQKHGKSLQLDGYSMLAQVGASVPLSAVLGLQTNFKYASHHRQFTPLGNYCKLLQDTSRELAILYDAAQRRSWLVPKLSLLLHMSHAYTRKCDGVPDDRVPYVEPHADAVEIIKDLESLGDTLVYGGQGHEFLFRQLILGLNTNLLKTVASIRDSSGKSLFGFEFMDVVNEPGRGACMKKLNTLPSGKIWLNIVNAVDAVVVCSELGEAIVAGNGSNKINTKCNMLPKDLDYLAATLSCLGRLAERQGVDLNAKNHDVRIAEKTLWSLKGDPFQVCQHNNVNETCWEQSDLIQQLVSEKEFIKFLTPARAPKPLSPIKVLPVSGAVVFGQRNA